MTMVATDAVYFADSFHGTINEVGAAVPLATNEKGATLLQANGANLFWYLTVTHELRRMATGSGAITTVFRASAPADGAATPDIGGFVVSPDGATIYISLGTQVLKAAVAGGPTSVVADEVRNGQPAALALDGTRSIVYPVMINGDVDAALLSAMPATCGADATDGSLIMTTCGRLARGQGELFSNFIAAIDGRAYWIDGPNLKGETIGLTGTSFEVIASAQTSEIMAAAATTDAIYFADAESTVATNGFIEKTALAPNSTPVLLARGQSAPLAIAVDASKVYWATSDCAIWSLKR
jgi:hypothetical protein